MKGTAKVFLLLFVVDVILLSDTAVGLQNQLFKRRDRGTGNNCLCGQYQDNGFL